MLDWVIFRALTNFHSVSICASTKRQVTLFRITLARCLKKHRLRVSVCALKDEVVGAERREETIRVQTATSSPAPSAVLTSAPSIYTHTHAHALY